jgi:hypothetical protein
VEAARTSIVSPKWVDAEIFHMEIITTIADERNKNISVRASFLPPYNGASIRFNFSDYDLEPDTTYILHVNANFLNKHNLLPTSYFCKGKDFEALPVLNATADQERIKNGEYMGYLEKINQDDLYEINSYHIDMDESKPPQRNPKVTLDRTTRSCTGQ